MDVCHLACGKLEVVGHGSGRCEVVDADDVATHLPGGLGQGVEAGHHARTVVGVSAATDEGGEGHDEEEDETAGPESENDS